jgi:chromosome partitioning protein
MTATVIAVAQRKGGAGKTTLAAHLAVIWACAGRAAALVDTDPQGSLTRWYLRREARLGRGGTGLDFVAITGWRSADEVVRRARVSDVVVIDTAANASIDVRAALRCAELVLVPVQPSPVDVWATVPTLELAQEERLPALLVLNRVPARATLTAAMRARLAEYDAGLAQSAVGNRIALAAAFAEGWGIAESAPASLAAQEIAALADEVLTLVPGAAVTAAMASASALELPALAKSPS